MAWHKEDQKRSREAFHVRRGIILPCCSVVMKSETPKVSRPLSSLLPLALLLLVVELKLVLELVLVLVLVSG